MAKQNSLGEDMPIKVAIVDDEKNILDSLSILLGSLPSLKIVGLYASGLEAMEKMSGVSPDVAIVDLKLDSQSSSGIEVIKEIKQTLPATDILVFSQFDDAKYVFPALKAGAVGYLLKDATPRQIIEGIMEARKDGTPMSRRITRLVLEEMHESPKNDGGYDSSLTPAEKKVLDLVATGLTRKEIGQHLYISDKTVHSHLKNIYKKLHARCKIEAVNRARQRRII